MNILVNDHTLVEEEFLSKKPGPSKFTRKFVVPNGETLKAVVSVQDGKKISHSFSYDTDYHYDDGPIYNGKEFKVTIEKDLPECKCSYKAESQEDDEDPEEQIYTLSFNCTCKSVLDGKFTKKNFHQVSKEVNYFASEMIEKAFKLDRKDF